MDQPIIRLRPHHALCLRHCAGQDNENTFNENRKALYARLNGGEREMVQIILHRDLLCAACPHQVNAACEQEVRMQQMDREIAAACSLRSGQWLAWHDLCAMLDAQNFGNEKCRELCAACPCCALCAQA